MWPPPKQERLQRKTGAPPRRFPLPWTVRSSEECYWIEDANGKRFAHTYFVDRDLPIGPDYERRLTRREALMIVRNLAKLPDLLRKS